MSERGFRGDMQKGLVLLLLLFAAYHLSGAGIIKAKAWLAPVLVESAWRRTLIAGQAGEKPWPWADTWPVARLRVPALAVNQLVLAGDSGNALAFGPGHATASARPGERGRVVIGGHRDTHFGFLRDLNAGEHLELEMPDSRRQAYRVKGAHIVDSRLATLARGSETDILLLVTCYPFDALVAGGPLRYVVSAEPVQTTATVHLLSGK